MRTSASKKLFGTVIPAISLLMIGLFHPGLARGQSCPSGFKAGKDAWGVQGCINVGYKCPLHGSWSVRDNKCDCLPQWPVWDNDAKQCLTAGSCVSGFQPGRDAWGVQGCINATYHCPSGGSWSVRDNKCDCLPATPEWDQQNKVCVAAAANPPPNAPNPPPNSLANCPEYTTYWDKQQLTPKDFCGVICPQDKASCQIDKITANLTATIACAATAAIPAVGLVVGLVCNIASHGAILGEPKCSDIGCHCGCYRVHESDGSCKDPLGRGLC